eukprot:Gb_14448 [translate_table: standard]
MPRKKGIKRGRQTESKKESYCTQNEENPSNHDWSREFEDQKGAKRGQPNRTKKVSSPIQNAAENHSNGSHCRESEDCKQLAELNHREVERRIVAIRAIRDAQIEHILTQLRVARSMFSKEQHSTPLLQFLNEYCPNTVAVKNSEGIIELQRKTQIHEVAGSYVNEGEWRASIGCEGSIGHQASVGLDDQTGVMPTPGGFHFTSSAVKDNFLRSIGMHFSHAVLEDNSTIKMTGQETSFQTPTMDFKMQPSIGMTPKSQRLPKRGEMLLSVHGSPLGVYCEDKMDTINESDKEP